MIKESSTDTYRLDVAAKRCQLQLQRRCAVTELFFTDHAGRLAAVCLEMYKRFLAGGKLVAFGSGPASTDAQHVSVEFVHPIIVGKKALPALDAGPGSTATLSALIRPGDMVIGFDFGSVARSETCEAIRLANGLGAMTIGLTCADAEHNFDLPDDDAFIRQEIAETICHHLWETVHVYFEYLDLGYRIGNTAFLYPFLGSRSQTEDIDAAIEHVRVSMLQKSDELNRIRIATASLDCYEIAGVAAAMRLRLAAGGEIVAFGNGGSATDANDFVLDCVQPPPELSSIPAISLSSDPAVVTAIANDVGTDLIFARQLAIFGREEDIALGFSTSGSSPNIIAALAEARKRGMLTVAIVGYDGGKIGRGRLADKVINVRSDCIPRIHEAQASIYHILRRRLGDFRSCSKLE